MTQKHFIVPPPELVQQWMDDLYGEPGQFVSSDDRDLAARAAQWGANQELEACCEWVRSAPFGLALASADQLRAARRPKPPSLKEQALALLNSVEVSDDGCSSWNFDIIRRALEALPND